MSTPSSAGSVPATQVPPSRNRLLAHGLLTGLLTGALAGVVDAVSSRNEFLDVTFLWVAVLAWTACWLPVALALTASAALLADPGRRHSWRSPGALAAGLTTTLGFLPLLLLLLVHLNVVWLGAATGASSLLADSLAGLTAGVLGFVLWRRLCRAFDRGGLARRLLATTGGTMMIAAVSLLTVHLTWPGSDARRGPPSPRADAASPNVVLILIDTLRRDHLSGEGYELATSPVLDRLARQGARFTSCSSQSSYTKPSVASLLTSRYLSGHHAGNMRSVLSEHHLTLTEAFSQAGYRTAMVVANPVVSRRHGFAQGADLFHTLEGQLMPQTKLVYALAKLGEEGRQLPLLEEVLAGIRAGLLGLERSLFATRGAEVTSLTAGEVIDTFRHWRSTCGDAPFFAYLHFMEPHAPYLPPPGVAERLTGVSGEPLVASYPPKTGVFLPFSPSPPLPPAERAGMIRAYDAEIAALDQELAVLIDEIRGLAGRPTLLAVTSDHGEEFYEHRGWGHGHSLHQELLRVPLYLAGPGIPAGTVVERTVQLIDLAPTLLQAARIPVPASMAGRSLLPLRQGRDGKAVETFAELRYGNTYWARALQQDGSKLIVSRLGERKQVSLFDLVADPGETRDLAEQHPAQVHRLLERIDQLVARAEQGGPGEESAGIDTTTEERLRALGYVQ